MSNVNDQFLQMHFIGTCQMATINITDTFHISMSNVNNQVLQMHSIDTCQMSTINFYRCIP